MRKCAPAGGTVGTDRPQCADSTPLPHAVAAGAEPRLVDVWCAFLSRLATDAEAAMAAAMAYRELDGQARDVWIAALEQDIERVDAPRIAIYAPLLAVETDPKRRARVLSAIGPSQAEAAPKAAAFALGCRREGNSRLAAIVAPLYLDFVQVLACAYQVGDRFDWVKHDPILERSRAPRPGDTLNGIVLETVPIRTVVDDLALTVVAHTRAERPLPEALSVFADLFGPAGTPPTDFAVPP